MQKHIKGRLVDMGEDYIPSTDEQYEPTATEDTEQIERINLFETLGSIINPHQSLSKIA